MVVGERTGATWNGCANSRRATTAPGPRPSRTGRSSTASTPRDLERELDELLDEVDAVLEENAEEFVKAYVQKGGE